MAITNDTLFAISAILIFFNIVWEYWRSKKRCMDTNLDRCRPAENSTTKQTMMSKSRYIKKRSDFMSINKYWPANIVVVIKESHKDEKSGDIFSEGCHVIHNESKWGNISLEDLPFLPGCEPNGSASHEMQRLFPDTSISDIVRFLVARKGDVVKAAELLSKSNAWRMKNLPLSPVVASPAVASGCFFTHGTANDGTPILYMRGALYDNRVATAETYVLLAAHIIDYVCKHSTKINVTVLVHAVAVPGAPNLNVDTNFIKLFIQALSDNYPERLKQLVIYPFPWYGRAIWSFLKGFVDKRSQDKVLLLSHEGAGVPPELTEFIDPNQIPVCCGGTNNEPIQDLMTTFESAQKDQSADQGLNQEYQCEESLCQEDDLRMTFS